MTTLRGPTLDGTDPARLLLALTNPAGMVLRTSVAVDVGTRMTVQVKLEGTNDLLPVEVAVVSAGALSGFPTVRIRLSPGGGPGVRVLSALASSRTALQAVSNAASSSRTRRSTLTDTAALATEVSRVVHGLPARLVLDAPVAVGLPFDAVVGTKRWPDLVRFKAISDGTEPGPAGDRHLVTACEDACRKRLLRFLLRLGVSVDARALHRAA